MLAEEIDDLNFGVRPQQIPVTVFIQSLIYSEQLRDKESGGESRLHDPHASRRILGGQVTWKGSSRTSPVSVMWKARTGVEDSLSRETRT